MTSEPDPEGLVDVDRYEWERWLRRCVLPQTVKTVGAYAAQYANRDGTRVYPGVARLVAVTSLSERSVRDALETLRRLGLLKRTRKGSSLGRQALTDEHRLTRPVDLERRVHLLDPDESPESAACNESCNHDRSPARPAAVKRPKRAAAETEHRHLTTGTPAGDSRTPAPHDRNTGRRCTPPMDDHSSYPPIDQRGDQLGDATTRGESVDLDGLKAKLIEFQEWADRRRGA